MQRGFYYDWINEYNGLRGQSGTVECDYNTFYFMRSLYQRALSILKFELPDTWDYQYFVNVLFKTGYIAIFDSGKYGIIPQICTISGYGLYYNPTDILVAQPLVQFNGTIGKNCELVRITPDYMPITDIIEHYARKMSQQWTAINMAIENSKISKLMAAKNKNAKLTLETIAEKISAGEPAVAYNKELKESIDGDGGLWTWSTNDSTYFVTEMLEVMDLLLRQFDSEIGIPAINNKKERMLSNEVDILSTGSYSRVNTWIECLKESVDKVNKMFYNKINISFTYNYKEEGGDNNINNS